MFKLFSSVFVLALLVEKVTSEGPHMRVGKFS